MKKNIIILLLIIFGGCLLFSIVNAQGYLGDAKSELDAAAGSRGANFGQANDPRMIVAYIIQIMLGLTGILFLGYTVYAGYIMLTSGGNEETMGKGRKMIFNGVIGFLIVFSSYAITVMVSKYLNFQSSPTDAFYWGAGYEVQEKPNDFFNNDPLNDRMPTIFEGANGATSPGGYTPPAW